MLRPNTFRVLIKPIQIEGVTTQGGIVLPGKLKVGENLLFGEIVDPGDTRFKIGQKVFYSEYSAAAIYDALTALQTGKFNREESLVVVAQDDVMAYYDDASEV